MILRASPDSLSPSSSLVQTMNLYGLNEFCWSLAVLWLKPVSAADCWKSPSALDQSSFPLASLEKWLWRVFWRERLSGSWGRWPCRVEEAVVEVRTRAFGEEAGSWLVQKNGSCLRQVWLECDDDQNALRNKLQNQRTSSIEISFERIKKNKKAKIRYLA